VQRSSQRASIKDTRRVALEHRARVGVSRHGVSYFKPLAEREDGLRMLLRIVYFGLEYPNVAQDLRQPLGPMSPEPQVTRKPCATAL